MDYFTKEGIEKLLEDEEVVRRLTEFMAMDGETFFNEVRSHLSPEELEEYLGNALEFHDSSELEAVIADAETLRKLGTPKSQKEEKGKELRKDMMKLYLGGGKTKKIRPGDIVGAICEIEGVCGDDIGVIQVQDHQSYVDILHGKGMQVLHALRRKTIKGKKLKVERAKE